MTAPGDDRWSQPGDEVMPEHGGQHEEVPEDVLLGDQDAASARRKALLDATADGKKQCPRCGAEAEPGLKRCAVCDQLLVGVGNCPVCGSRLDDTMPACPDCGTPNPRYKREHQL